MKRKHAPVAEESENWCFVCKDGGKLILCDYGGCPKVYHADCVGLKKSFFKSHENWNCWRHFCSLCHRREKDRGIAFYCLSCPISLCRQCIKASSSAVVKKNSRMCNICLNLAVCLESKAKLNPDGEKMNVNDSDTYECRYKEYMEILMEQQGLSLRNLCHVKDQLVKHESVSSQATSSEDEDSGSIQILSSSSDTAEVNRVVGKIKTSIMKEEEKKEENAEWASKPLIEFLRSRGKDTAQELSPYEVESVLSTYIVEKKLLDKNNKVVNCDDQLYSIFETKSMPIHKIYTLLRFHLNRNNDLDDDSNDDDDDDGDDGDGNESILGHKNKEIKTDLSFSDKMGKIDVKSSDKVAFEVPKSTFASIVVDNIKLVYLRKSLVEKLLKESHDSEDKLVGSFVKVKKVPSLRSEKASHQLLQVQGIIRPANSNITTGILLQVSCLPMAIDIALLSDEEILEVECEELQESISKGLHKKLTVSELEKKAISIHEDICKHWIEWKLRQLQSLINFAAEKRRRRELDQYLEERAVLEHPIEQQKMLLKLPTIIAAELEAEQASTSKTINH